MSVPPFLRSRFGRYGVAFLAVGASAGLHWTLTAWVGEGLPTFITFYPAVMVAALVGGLGPGLVATLLSTLVVDYWVLPPHGQFTALSLREGVALGVFGCLGSFMSVMAALYRRDREKAAAYDRETALCESQARLRAFAEATSEGVVESESGRIVDCNEQFARMVGCSVEELKGVEIASLVAPEDRERVTANIRDNRESTIEHSMCRRDGRRLIVEARGRSVIPNNPRRHTAVRDITERKRAEAEIAQLNHDLQRRVVELQAILDTSPIGLAIAEDPQGLHIRGNPANERLLGLPPGSELSLRASRPGGYRTFQDGQELPADALPMQRACRGEAVTGQMLDIVRPDGTTVTVFSSAAPLLDEQGRPRGAVGAFLDITERKQVEQTLREREAKLALALRSAGMGVWRLELGKQTRHFDHQVCRCLGIDPTRFRGTTEEFYAAVHPEDHASLKTALAQCVENGKPYEVEYRVVWPDGSLHHVASRGQLARDATGRPERVDGLVWDITLRKEAEERIRRYTVEQQAANTSLREARRAALNLMDDALASRRHAEQVNAELAVAKRALEEERDILQAVMSGAKNSHLVYLDRNFNFVRVNETYARTCGYRPEEMIGKNHFALYPDPENEAIFVRARDTGEAVSQHDKPFEFPDQPERGVTYWDWTLIPVKDQRDEVTGLVFSLFETTTYKRVETALAQARANLEQKVEERTAELQRAMQTAQTERQRLYDVLETLPAMICLLAPDHRIAWANRTFRERLGETRGRRCYEAYYGLGQPCEFCESHRVLTTNHPHHWEVSAPNGGMILDSYDFPFTDVDGSPLILKMNIDITARRKAELEQQSLRDELARVSRSNTAGQLAAAMAHELNQPLGAIVCNAQAAQQYFKQVHPPLEEVKEILGDIEADGKRAGEVIHRLRALYQKTGQERTPLQLNGLIQQTVELMHSELVLKGVELQLDLSSAAPAVLGSFVQLQQVLINLILNALDAMGGRDPGARPLQVSTDRPGTDMVQVSLRDFGTGLSADQLSHLGEPFYTTKSKGMGMGLAISRSIVEAHGGRLWAENNPEGGATFHFSLPALSNHPS